MKFNLLLAANLMAATACGTGLKLNTTGASSAAAVQAGLFYNYPVTPFPQISAEAGPYSYKVKLAPRGVGQSKHLTLAIDSKYNAVPSPYTSTLLFDLITGTIQPHEQAAAIASPLQGGAYFPYVRSLNQIQKVLAAASAPADSQAYIGKVIAQLASAGTITSLEIVTYSGQISGWTWHQNNSVDVDTIAAKDGDLLVEASYEGTVVASQRTAVKGGVVAHNKVSLSLPAVTSSDSPKLQVTASIVPAGRPAGDALATTEADAFPDFSASDNHLSSVWGSLNLAPADRTQSTLWFDDGELLQDSLIEARLYDAEGKVILDQQWQLPKTAADMTGKDNRNFTVTTPASVQTRSDLAKVKIEMRILPLGGSWDRYLFKMTGNLM